MVEQLLEQPLALGIIGLIVVIGLGRLLWQRRRDAALRGLADDQGWRALDDGDGFVRRVLTAFPEIRDEVEQDARAARGRRGPARGPGTTIRVGAAPGVRSRGRAREVFAVPADGGEVVVGDVQVTGQAGKVAQGRTSGRRGAAVAELTTPAPTLRLFGRAWLDRDGGDRLPPQVAESFSEGELGEGAVATYFDSGAADLLLEVADDVDGVSVDGTTAVLLARSSMTPDRARELSSTLSRFLGRASAPGGSGLSPASFPDR